LKNNFLFFYLKEVFFINLLFFLKNFMSKKRVYGDGEGDREIGEDSGYLRAFKAPPRNYHYTIEEFDSFCKQTLNKSASDLVKNEHFDAYISRNLEFLNLDFLLSKIYQVPENLDYTAFVGMWFSTYGEGLQLTKDQSLAILHNIKGFSERKAIALQIVEDNNYDLPELKEIIHAVADMSDEELRQTDDEDGVFRGFEVKFRLAIAWLSKLSEEERPDAIGVFCKELDFANTEHGLERVLEGFASCDDIIDEYRQNSKIAEEASGLFEDIDLTDSGELGRASAANPSAKKMQVELGRDML